MSDCSVQSVQTRPVVLGEGDTLPVPSVTLLGGDGNPAEMDNITGVVLHLTDKRREETDDDGNVTYTPTDLTVAGVRDGTTSSWDFALTALQTADAIDWRTHIVVTESGSTFTFPTAPVSVVDYTALWAEPTMVAELAAGFSNSEYLLAILRAEEAVRAWVTTTISSPVSGRVSYAVSLLAARALSSPFAGPQISSETMGDYTVRFNAPAQGGFVISDEIADLLAPWRPRDGSVYVGPDDDSTALDGSFATTQLV